MALNYYYYYYFIVITNKSLQIQNFCCPREIHSRTGITQIAFKKTEAPSTCKLKLFYFVGFCNLVTSGSRSDTLANIRNAVLQKEGKDHLDL
jgi:hypothetical protein